VRSLEGRVTALLSLTTILAWGCWIPLAQAVPGVPQRSRTFYVTLGNVAFALAALAVGGGHVVFGWRQFWLPFAGGVVWTGGNYSAFRATESIGLARASGSWTPLNIIVAFVWGALLFGELRSFDAARFAVLGTALAFVMAGILVIIRSQDARVIAAGQVKTPARVEPVVPATRARAWGATGSYRRGLLLACVAGVLWGSYFIPAQWAKVPAQVSNFPLALGILAAGLILVMTAGGPVRLNPRSTAVQLAAGVLFGAGNVSLLGLVSRVGTGVGFTIAQLSLLANVGIGIFVFKVPEPHSHAARVALIGVLLAGAGGVVIGSLR
jgi:glucose uptake protein